MVVRNAALRMNGLSIGGWHDELDAERLRMEIVEAFEACVSDNGMQRKRGRENPGKSSSRSEKSASKGLEKGFQGLDGFGADISTKAATDKFKRPKRSNV